MPELEQTLEKGLAHHRQGNLSEAEMLYRQVLAAQADHVDALQLLGVLAHQSGRHREAVELIHRALAHGPVAALYNNLGEAYRELGEDDQAAAAYQQALALEPNFAEALNNLGTIYQHRGQLKEAVELFDRALACRPDYATAHNNRARTWLMQGDYLRGWPEYEWRWRLPEFVRPALAIPEWDGAPLAGRRLLVRAEQGFGDTLQFIRYVPLLQSQGASVVAEVQDELIPLLTQSGIGPLVPQSAAAVPGDVHLSLMSLPGRLGTALATIPAGAGYISADASLVAAWGERLRHLAGVRVGICWQGNPRFPNDRLRSIPLAEFEPLARVPGVTLVALQKGHGLEQLAATRERFAIHDLRPDYDHEAGAFLNAAAVIGNLDLVVTSDTAMAHLAGALGAAAWVVLPHTADWRWLRDRSDSPWYPTLRLFRQRQRGDWSSVMKQVAEQLSERRFSGAREYLRRT
ncbi:MAG: tetratricopeptide repeat protein [Pirellulales bacterium]